MNEDCRFDPVTSAPEVHVGDQEVRPDGAGDFEGLPCIAGDCANIVPAAPHQLCELLADQRTTKPRLLTAEVLEVVRLRLAEPPTDGGVWSSRKAA